MRNRNRDGYYFEDPDEVVEDVGGPRTSALVRHG